MASIDDPRSSDPFIRDYDPSELRIASEFLTRWMPFLSRGLCDGCAQLLSNHVRSIDPEIGVDAEPFYSSSSTPNITETHDHDDSNIDTQSSGSWRDTAEVSNLSESCQESATGSSQPVVDTSPSVPDSDPPSIQSRPLRMSWADMAQEEDELQAEEQQVKQVIDGNCLSGEVGTSSSVERKPEWTRDQRERFRFENVKRKADFICLERVNGKIVNILDGLELHCGVFSAAEQRKIVDHVYLLQEMGRNGNLQARTFSAPKKWMRGKGRVTIQFGCCYNYAPDKSGNPPGIVRRENVDPLPDLFKVMIKRLIRWRVLPPSCVPDSCIVNIYDEGDCIPPHIDNHDFVRPFCTVSFLSECDIFFGSNLTVVAPGEFTGSFALPLPVGSVLVLNGNGADVAKHCVPAVPSKRISITFRKMDESKRPFRFVPEPDLLGLKPLAYETEDRSKGLDAAKPQPHKHREARRRNNVVEREAQVRPRNRKHRGWNE